MKRIKLILFVFILVAVTSTVAISAGQQKQIKDHHADLTCFDCHLEDQPTHSTRVVCSSCHGSPAEVAELTAKKYKKHYNPHEPLHFGTEGLCEGCHREHEPSILSCNSINCHAEFEYKTP